MVRADSCSLQGCSRAGLGQCPLVLTQCPLGGNLVTLRSPEGTELGFLLTGGPGRCLVLHTYLVPPLRQGTLERFSCALFAPPASRDAHSQHMHTRAAHSQSHSTGPGCHPWVSWGPHGPGNSAHRCTWVSQVRVQLWAQHCAPGGDTARAPSHRNRQGLSRNHVRSRAPASCLLSLLLCRPVLQGPELWLALRQHFLSSSLLSVPMPIEGQAQS